MDDRTVDAILLADVVVQAEQLEVVHPEQLMRGITGLTSGPSMLKNVRTPSARRTPPTLLSAGLKNGAWR